MFDGFEPTTMFCSAAMYGGAVPAVTADGAAGGGCTRGSAGLGWLEGCYTGTRHPAIPGPIFNIFLRLGPTHGRMNLKYSKMMRFPR